jgi:hydroxylamine reductase
MKGMAAYAEHAYVLGKKDTEIMDWFFKGMKEFAEDSHR